MYYYLLVLLLLWSMEIFYFRIADRYNIIDKPNERSSHHRITLRGGGIIFYLGALVYFLTNHYQYPWFMLGLTLISLVSFIDDIRSVPRGIRLIVHFTAMFLLFSQLGLLSGMPWWYTLVALIISTGIINAYNFMDGINGITGGYSLVLLLSLAWINHYRISFVAPPLLYTLILSVLVFNLYNFRPQARCFAGDVGSVSIAFILVFLLGRLMITTHDLSYIILLSVYGVDTVLTILHRLRLKEDISLPHRKHLYQLMANELKIPHITVSLIYMSLQALIIIGYLCSSRPYIYLLVTVLLLSLIYILFMRKYYHLHQPKSVSPCKK
ncbi:MAG: UDP-GlcNAc--UDP-phosphate GlcNAc-1-phosphate transferase [Coprobacter sp.]|nr:glycosyltransferase family 4 protein [Barnesiella sp. GGCC_0306]PWM92227.1 MAG: UDP-GlcNAc--UDP-phosphate GlcNAc-1-phosphate transferase [Coprobacter sp.]